MSAATARLLTKPIPWSDHVHDPELGAMLGELQANILKGHGRDHTGNVFVGFGNLPPTAIAALLRSLSATVTSALAQLQAAADYRAHKVDGGRVVCLFLSAAGYAKLGLPAAKIPADPAFLAGMRARGQAPTISFANLPPVPGLNDPSATQWGAGPWAPANPAPDAMILVADDSTVGVTAGLEAIERIIGDGGGRVIGVDRGEAQRRNQPGGSAKGEGLEHFGYVDGRSQPLFLMEDIATEPREHWDPSFPPAQFIVCDPGGRSNVACGSYLVYRKLEQNVRSFKDSEDRLAAAMGLTGDDAERAGALVVGRFEDSTPVVESGSAVAGPPSNDFNYDHDPDGLKCPFRAHIRKTNPRGESDRKHGAIGTRGERSRIMARRGITYGQRAARPHGADFAEDDRPVDEVGLLFMAYMANIAEQFEFTQAAWAGNPDFVEPDTGIDPVIGQRANSAGTAQTQWLDGESGKRADFDFGAHVRLLGGDYFFAPSLGFLAEPLG